MRDILATLCCQRVCLLPPSFRYVRHATIASNLCPSSSMCETPLDRMIPDGVGKYGPEILVLESETDVPATIKQQLGKPQFVCGSHPAFIPTPVSGDLREASEMVYLPIGIVILGFGTRNLLEFFLKR